MLLPGALLTLLALLAMGRILPNAFVQDDSGVLIGHPLIRHWDGLWRAFGQPYWPLDNGRELYRPLSIAWFTIQWQLGHGAPILFRVVSLGFYVACVLAAWRLLRQLVPAAAAWVGAALFAVHPVHTEAVAVGVNQSELAVAALLTVALTLRLRAAGDGRSTRATAWSIWALFVVAILIKEHALVLPGLLLAADLLLADDARGWRGALWRWRWLYAGLLVTGAAFWLVRTGVLGPGTGTQAAEALEGAGLLQRAFTMLGVPAEWLRLLLWPAHLQTDWNPVEWVPSRAWTVREWAGLSATVSLLLAFVLAWRRRPVLAFGLSWMVVSLAPVANLVMPTGIILAERTLFLPSVGFVIVVADLVAPLARGWGTLPRPARLAAVVLLGSALTLGVLRSAARMGDWRDRPTFLITQLRDAPTSWHAQLAYGFLLSDAGDTAGARLALRRAIRLRADDPLISKHLADRMRLSQGRCAGPALLYQELLRVVPGRSDLRGSLVACELWLGRYAEARAEAERGVASGLDADYYRYVVGVADSAERAAAPAGTVRLRPVGARTTVIGDPHATPGGR
ncbi:MAG TPA: hypothetical protein VFS07_03510 [Gemmatimonadales bacterium]|nr:hypothetical protein [Gemmatimonadales bacterium]